MAPESDSDPRPFVAAGIALRVEDDPPPVVRALANDLAARLGDPTFAEGTSGVRGTVSLRDSGTPQSATIRIDDHGVTVKHGFAEGADLRATVDMPGMADPRLEGGEEHPKLAEWLKSLLGAQDPEWPEAAARFWSVLSRMSGAPAALQIVDLETGNDRRYGSQDGRAYEVHGRSEDLAAVLSGRDPVVDAGFAGRIFVRGSFAELSVVSGAGFRVRYGPAPDGPGEAKDASSDAGAADA